MGIERRLLGGAEMFLEAQTRSAYIHSAFCFRKARHCCGPGNERETEWSFIEYPLCTRQKNMGFEVWQVQV